MFVTLVEKSHGRFAQKYLQRLRISSWTAQAWEKNAPHERPSRHGRVARREGAEAKQSLMR